MARILLIGIDYYDYVREIRAAFARVGHTCEYHPIENVGPLHKAMRNHAPALYRRMLDARHRRIVRESAATAYDHVVFIQCHHFSHANMEALRASQPQARFALYNWDSLTTHDYRPWLRHFDSAKTFDPGDAEALGIGYLPLFAIPRFFRTRERAADYDLYFVGAIGTMHRFEALEKLYAHAQSSGLKLFYHLKCSPPIRLKLKRLGKNLPGVTGASMSFDEIVEVMERSRATFDFANHRQSGFTMRFIENMCAGRKIVTENPRVLDAPFYRDDRFLLVRDHDFSELADFLARPITSQLDTTEYSVDAWARHLLED